MANGAKAPSIHKAASMGMMADTKEFLEKGTDVNAKDDQGMTPLHLAAQGGHAKVMELLISKGANVNARNSKAQTPLHLTIRDKKIQTAEELIVLLLSKGVDLNVKDSSGSTVFDEAALGFTPRKIFEFLLSKDAKVSMWRLFILFIVVLDQNL